MKSLKRNLFSVYFIMLLASNAPKAQDLKRAVRGDYKKEQAASPVENKEFERRRLYQVPNPSELSSERIQKFNNTYLYEESLLVGEVENGVYEDDYYTGRDNHHFYFSHHFSSKYDELGSLTSLEIGYKTRLKSFTKLWLSFLYKKTQAPYSLVASESTSEGSNADGNKLRRNAKQDFSTLGLGGGYRFLALTHFIDSNRFFETVFAHLNYNDHTDAQTGLKYNGFGFNMDYSLLYRSSRRLSYGVKLSYNIAPVAREPIDNEPREDRSLVFGWTSIGFELGYFY